MEEKQSSETEQTLQAKKRTKKKKEITVKANKKGKHVMKFLNVLRVLVLPLLRIVRPFRLYGNKKVQDGACVYVCNHFGMLDPMFPVATTWEGIHFVAKKEIFDVPVLGWALRKIKAIPANRNGNDLRVILDCFKCLKNGEKICIFPEGTRNKTGEALASFQHGASAIAIKAKAPVVPMMIYQKPRRFRKTHVIVGEPFEFEEYYGKKLQESDYVQADEKLRDIMLELRERHAEFLARKKKQKA